MKRHFTFTVILKWIYVISKNNSFVVFSVKYYGRDELKIKQYGEQLNSHQVTLSCDIASFALNFFLGLICTLEASTLLYPNNQNFPVVTPKGVH